MAVPGVTHFGDTTFHDSLCLFGIFQLIADRHAVSGFHQFVEVAVEAWCGKPASSEEAAAPLLRA